MRKLVLTSALIFVSVISVVAQVGIGTTTPNSSSVLDLTSTNKAFIPPRMTTAQRNSIATPAAGMMIFNTDSTCVEIYRGSSWFNICTGKSSVSLPPVDGLTSSNQVAPTHLIGYWPFDGSTTEQVNSKAPVLTGGTSTFVTGKIGQAISFNNGWLAYPNTATGAGVGTNPFGNNDTLAGGYTVSMWVQVPDTSLLTSIFQLSKQNVQNWPLLGFAYRKHADSTIDFDGGLTNIDGTGTHPSYADAYSGAFKDSLSWAFITMVYDTSGAGHKLIYYANGTKRVTVNLNTIASTPFPAGGNLQMICNFPEEGNYANIGTFESSTTTPNGAGTIPGFMSAGITAKIDDIRFFNITLTAQQISDLFQLGNQGR